MFPAPESESPTGSRPETEIGGVAVPRSYQQNSLMAGSDRHPSEIRLIDFGLACTLAGDPNSLDGGSWLVAQPVPAPVKPFDP